VGASMSQHPNSIFSGDRDGGKIYARALCLSRPRSARDPAT